MRLRPATNRIRLAIRGFRRGADRPVTALSHRHSHRGFQLALAVLLAVPLFSGESHAQSAPWFDSFLVKFPEALLIEREPSPLLVSAAPMPVPNTENAGNAGSSSFQAEDSLQTPIPLHTRQAVQHSQTAPLEQSVPVADSTSPRYMFSEGCRHSNREYWQILPDGVLYPSYLAGEKEPRMGVAVLDEKDRGPILESTIGGRLGLLRHGTQGPVHAQGWQWDLESAAMLRQDFDEQLDVEATDFRIGTVLTWKRGATAVKGGIYHLSSHVGDEFLQRNPTFQRINYSRNVLLFGVRQSVTAELIVYGEIGYAVTNDGGSEPLELQFGTEYSSLKATNPTGAPFAAMNVHLREEFDFGGGLNILAGWEWRGPDSNRRFRAGVQYYTGKEIQFSFFDENIQLIGAGIWYDF